jgi:hypothetical protein
MTIPNNLLIVIPSISLNLMIMLFTDVLIIIMFLRFNFKKYKDPHEFESTSHTVEYLNKLENRFGWVIAISIFSLVPLSNLVLNHESVINTAICSIQIMYISKVTLSINDKYEYLVKILSIKFR